MEEVTNWLVLMISVWCASVWLCRTHLVLYGLVSVKCWRVSSSRLTSLISCQLRGSHSVPTVSKQHVFTWVCVGFLFVLSAFALRLKQWSLHTAVNTMLTNGTDIHSCVCQFMSYVSEGPTTILWPLYYRSTCVSWHWRILLVQSFTARMPLLTTTSAFGLGRRCWSFPQQCYLHCLRTLSEGIIR